MASADGANSWVVPVAGLFVAVFAVITAELIVAGLLPAIAADFSVDIPTAGLLITGYAAAVAIAGPLLSLATNGFSRRSLLLAVMVIFVVGNMFCALASSYGLLLAARLVVACCHGLVFGVAMVVANRLAPEGRQSSTAALVVAGNTVANILGVPLGAAIGNAYGWRVSFWVIAVAGAAAAVVLLALLPRDQAPGRGQRNLAAELRAAGQPIVLLVYGIMTVFTFGVIMTLGYIVPILTNAVGVPLAYVPWVLFGMGVSGFVGNFVGGRLGDWNPALTMLGVICICTVLLLVMGSFIGNPWIALPCLWGTWSIGFGFVAPARTRIYKATRHAPNFAATLVSSAFNVGIAVGSAVGGAALAAGWGYGALPLIHASAFAVAGVGTLLLVMLDRRTPAAVPA